MEKIGLYGGTFGPPHLGHVYAAKTFLREVAPDRLLIMPAGIPPHKEKAAGDTPELRLAMCRAAFGDLPHTEISDYEIRKPGKSYTVETLEHLAAPGREITMLCGTDMFLTLDHWHRAPDIFALCTVACLARENGMETAIRETAERLSSPRPRSGKNCAPVRIWRRICRRKLRKSVGVKNCTA